MRGAQGALKLRAIMMNMPDHKAESLGGAELFLEPDPYNCVRTLAQKEYHRLLREILSREEASEIACEKLEILRVFLESTDFVKLRRQYEPHLVRGKRVRFVLWSGGSQTEYRIEVMGEATAAAGPNGWRGGSTRGDA